MRKLKPSIRRNRNTRNGQPGSFKLRVTLMIDPKMKGRMVELGLGTNDRKEAEARAHCIILALETAGLYRRPAVRILEHHIAQFNRVDKYPINHPELPLW